MPEPMEIDAFLADSVEAVNGKLYCLGAAWNHVFTPTTPFRQPRIGIGMAVHVPYTATNEVHRFSVRLEDADGQAISLQDVPPGVEMADAVAGKLYRLGGQFTIGRPPLLAPGSEQIVSLGLNFDGLVFGQIGGYCFVITIDDVDVKWIRFSITQIPTPQMGPYGPMTPPAV